MVSAWFLIPVAVLAFIAGCYCGAFVVKFRRKLARKIRGRDPV
jgi:Kef-type K+ transport system membrane component KefB